MIYKMSVVLLFIREFVHFGFNTLVYISDLSKMNLPEEQTLITRDVSAGNGCELCFAVKALDRDHVCLNGIYSW